MIGLQAESIRSAWSSIGICVALASTAAFSAPSQTWPHFHGKPVIASRFTPWGELAEKGCGWWVDNAPESLAKTIAEAASLPRERLTEMGEKGRKLVEAKYTWEAVAKTMVEGYERVGE